jgi:ComF family protein
MASVGAIVKTATVGLARLGGGAVDFVYPPTCLSCHAPVARADALCASCFGKLRPISRPYCPVLGIPFEVDLGPGALSAEAIANPPPYQRARTALVYNQVAGLLVSRLKYGDRPELASFCARLMASAGHELLGPDAVLLPVPLHPARQFFRRYNQSAEIARALGRLTAMPLLPGLVRRKRATRRQVGLSADARGRNVAGAFIAAPDALVRLKGRRVVIVDDVITTGSTVRAVALALKRAGVDKIDVIGFARVVVGVETPI